MGIFFAAIGLAAFLHGVGILNPAPKTIGFFESHLANVIAGLMTVAATAYGLVAVYRPRVVLAGSSPWTWCNG